MKYAILMGGLGVGSLWLGLTALPGGVLLAWLGLSFLVVALGYAGSGPRVLGKRHDGVFHPLASAMLLPYRLLNTLLWVLYRRISKEPAAHEVAPGLWLGRRPSPRELPAGVSLMVDLAGEFPRVCRGRAGCEYLSLPCLDTAVPAWPSFRAAVSKIADYRGTIYVHCALGHGRSATVVAAVLIARGLASGPQEAEERVRSVRAGVKLSAAQRALLHRYCAERGDLG